MEEKREFEKLERLERSVERLLTGYNNLRQEKSALDELLENKNVEIQKLTDQVAFLKGERDTVHQRVSGLLSSIVEWEETQTAMSVIDNTELKEEVDFEDGVDGAPHDDPQMSMMSMMSVVR